MKIKDGMRRAVNAEAWCIGHVDAQGFHVRHICWTRQLAKAWKRHPKEQVRRAYIIVAERASR